jgi:beta-glucosidase
MGCDLIGKGNTSKEASSRVQAAVKLAKESDAVVFVGGITGELEGEEMPIDYDGFMGGDRTHLDIPKVQEDLLRLLHATGKPIVLVLTSGSALSVNWEKENITAIVQLWYPGQEGGTALANVLFGDYNPGGRLPVTFYQSVDDLPPFENYNMKGRTYRYFDKKPLFAFGFGLSYTKFEYRNLTVPAETKAGDSLEISVEVHNIGKIPGDEVVQLYVRDLAASVPTALLSLQGFTRVHLRPDEKRILKFHLKPKQLAVIHDNGKFVVEPGLFEISIGGTQPGIESLSTHCITKESRVTGSNFVVR